mgnify:CR=1 FL=1
MVRVQRMHTSSDNINITNQTMSSPNSRGTRDAGQLACLVIHKSVRVVGFREDSPLELDLPGLRWANAAENGQNCGIWTLISGIDRLEEFWRPTKWSAWRWRRVLSACVTTGRWDAAISASDNPVLNQLILADLWQDCRKPR